MATLIKRNAKYLVRVRERVLTSAATTFLECVRQVFLAGFDALSFVRTITPRVLSLSRQSRVEPIRQACVICRTTPAGIANVANVLYAWNRHDDTES